MKVLSFIEWCKEFECFGLDVQTMNKGLDFYNQKFNVSFLVNPESPYIEEMEHGFVTRDMALDAGEPSMEGMPIEIGTRQIENPQYFQSEQLRYFEGFEKLQNGLYKYDNIKFEVYDDCIFEPTDENFICASVHKDYTLNDFITDWNNWQKSYNSKNENLKLQWNAQNTTIINLNLN